MKAHFTPVAHSLFFKSPRPHDKRLGEYSESISMQSLTRLTQQAHLIVGYPDDRGVAANHGRTGASLAPDMIRKFLYRLAPRDTNNKFYDLGNLDASSSLSETQEHLKLSLFELHQKGLRILSFGGGNDYAYPDISAFLAKYSRDGLVIHIDAHYDMRPVVDGPTSGTPLLQCFQEHGNFDLCAIGIQDFANTPYFFTQAESKKVKTVLFQNAHGNLKKTFALIAKKKRPTFLAIDMDAFSANYAPGVSAPSAVGLDANEFLLALPVLLNKLDVRGVGIYETNPKFDSNDMTSRLAAVIGRTFLTHKLTHGQAAETSHPTTRGSKKNVRKRK